MSRTAILIPGFPHQTTRVWYGLGCAAEDAMDKIGEGIQETSEHKTLDLCFAMNRHLRRVAGQVICKDCMNVWRSYIPEAAFLNIASRNPAAFLPLSTWAEELTRMLVPDLSKALDQPCWAADQLSGASEWITMRVRNAGPRGIPLRSLIQMAADLRICPPERTLYLLRYMGFTPSGALVPAVIRLPSTHPMRIWAGDMPNPEDGTLDEGVLQAIGSSTPWFPV